MYSFIASAALLAGAAAASSVGQARVINACKYDVYLYAVPAANGGYNEVDKVLSPGDTFNQTWTQLTNLMGWSIKLSKDTTMSNIMQYEYTYIPGEPIWFDLSDVNGNPWDGDWEITADGTCKPRQAAYRYATDDAYGMQDCPASTDITVTLCSGESQDDDAASSAAASFSSVAKTISTSAAPTSTPTAIGTATTTPVVSVAPTTSAAKASAPVVKIAEASSSVQQTTLMTSAIASVVSSAHESVITENAVVFQNGEIEIVTEIATVVVTEIATATAYEKRDEHMHRHAHHPHMRV